MDSHVAHGDDTKACLGIGTHMLIIPWIHKYDKQKERKEYYMYKKV